MLFSDAYEDISIVGCGANFSANSGTVVSPGFPGNYDNNMQCDYIIKLDDPSKFIMLSFDPQHFRIEGRRNRDIFYVPTIEGSGKNMTNSTKAQDRPIFKRSVVPRVSETANSTTAEKSIRPTSAPQSTVRPTTSPTFMNSSGRRYPFKFFPIRKLTRLGNKVLNF